MEIGVRFGVAGEKRKRTCGQECIDIKKIVSRDSSVLGKGEEVG